MIHSHIYLTQTHINKDILQRQIAYHFYTNGDFDLFGQEIDKVDITKLNNLFDSLTNTQQVIILDFASKSDYRNMILSLYMTYDKPTIIFLGDLNAYSIQLQEGMLRLLEEPPRNVFIVLFAHTRNEILSTITSRSQIHLLETNQIMGMLDVSLKDKVKKKLPVPGETAKNLMSKSFDYNQIKDFSKFEREEIDFWLWQVGVYLTEYYKQKPHISIGNALRKIFESQKLNSENSLKKFVFANLSL